MTEQPGNDTTRKALIAGAGLVLGIVLAIWVWADLRGDRIAMEAMYSAEIVSIEEQVSGLETDLAQASADIAALKAWNDLYKARILLGRALQQFERRNFGTANDDLRSANEALSKVDAEAAMIDATVLAGLLEGMSNTDLRVASDLASQRTALIELAERLDKLLQR